MNVRRARKGPQAKKYQLVVSPLVVVSIGRVPSETRPEPKNEYHCCHENIDSHETRDRSQRVIYRTCLFLLVPSVVLAQHR
jgi:hypothetical protein